MTPFTYHRPTGLEDAKRLLAESAGTTKLIAGGQSLLLALKERKLRPQRVLSLSGLPELRGIRVSSDGRVCIGATTTYAALAKHAFPGWQAEMAAVAGNLADRSVRSLGTIGGAVCQAEPRYDMPTLLTAANARMHVVSLGGERFLEAADFFNADGGTHLDASEILTHVTLPPVASLDTLTFEKFRFRVFDAAYASVACALKIDGDGRLAQVRIVVGAVANAPMIAAATARALTGRPLAELRDEAIGIQVAAELAPLHATLQLRPRYQGELIISLTAKAFKRAAAPLLGA